MGFSPTPAPALLSAVAGESGVAFISSSAAEFIEMYMGLGAARVRDLFNTVRVALVQFMCTVQSLDGAGRQLGAYSIR